MTEQELRDEAFKARIEAIRTSINSGEGLSGLEMPVFESEMLAWFDYMEGQGKMIEALINMLADDCKKFDLFCNRNYPSPCPRAKLAGSCSDVTAKHWRQWAEREVSK